MINKLIVAVGICLTATFIAKAQETPFWKNIGVQIKYDRTLGFTSDPTPDTYQWNIPKYGTFGLGLTYDLRTEARLSYSYTLSVDWLIDKRNYKIDDPFFNPNIIERTIQSNGTVYFTSEIQFLYAINGKRDFHLMLAPQINYFLFNDFGLSSTSGRRFDNNYQFEFSTVDRNRILRPSLAVGLQYDVSSKSRLGAFYSHSFTPIQFGEFTYENSNGVMASGDWKLQGHQVGISYQFYPFRAVDPEVKKKRIEKKKIALLAVQNQKRVRFGIKTGINFSTLRSIELRDFDNGAEDYKSTEFYGGLFVDTRISTHWNLQNELLLSYTDEFTFLEIPIVFKRKITKKLWALIGPRAQLVINDNDEVDHNFGLALDAGLQYDLPQNFFIEARYGQALNPQFTSPRLNIIDARRNLLRLSVGYRF